jgi:hypothetical protein
MFGKSDMSMELDPETKEIVGAVKRVLLELQFYETTYTVDDELGRSVDTLVAAGALSPESAAFIARHRARFFGLRPKPIRPGIPVLEVLLAGRATPFRVVGFRDGHVECVPS